MDARDVLSGPSHHHHLSEAAFGNFLGSTPWVTKSPIKIKLFVDIVNVTSQICCRCSAPFDGKHGQMEYK